MNFYQPNISLYDVLNALAEQNVPRNPQERFHESRRRQFPSHNHAHRGGRGHSYGHQHPFQQQYPFGGGFGGPSFYRIPNEGYYYSPQYGYYDDSDEQEQQNDGDMDEDENEDQNSNDIPSYYHTQGSRSGSKENQQDYLSSLLNALVNGQQLQQTTFGESDKEEPEVEVPEENQSKATTQKTEKDDVKKEEETEKEVVSQPVPEHPSKVQEDKDMKRNPNSFAHLQAPSPIPDPLQISKPETRLDLPFSPEVNVYDLHEKYTVVLSLPGANSKAFKIDYHPSSHELLIKGNVIDRLGIDEKYLKITEIKYGAFERTIKFPVLPRIKDDEIKATYSNGLLQINVPKELTNNYKPAPKKRIDIEDIPDEELEFEKNPNPVQKE